MELIRATALWGYDAVVAELGADPIPLRARFGLHSPSEENDDAFVPFEPFIALVESTATELGCDDFGMRVGRQQGMPMLGPVAVIARNSATVSDGVAAIARFLPAHSAALRLVVEPPEPDGEVRIRYLVTRRMPFALAQSWELAMTNASQIIRLLSGGTTGPSRIWLPHARISSPSTYQHHLACPVEFEGDGCGLAVAGEVMAQAIDTADPQTREMAAAYLESNFPLGGATLAHRVSDLIRRLLPTGHYSADVVADQLHLHRRTLQRRLLDEGATYADLLDEQRRVLAVRYLAEPELQVGQISVLLGYTEHSAFNRAFRRWFGTSPRDYRAAVP